MEILLPDKKSEIETDFSKYMWLVYGQPKIGKSTFASRFPKPLFMSTEPGLKGLEVFKVDIDNWSSFCDYCLLLATKKNDFSTIVIDTIDNLYQMCIEHVCNEFDMIHPSDKDYGKGWSFVNNEFSRVITKLSMLNYGLVFISHDVIRDVELGVIKISKTMPTVGTGARKILLGLCDVIAHCGMKQDKEGGGQFRGVQTRPNRYIEAGDRVKITPGNFELPSTQEEFDEIFPNERSEKKNSKTPVK